MMMKSRAQRFGPLLAALEYQSANRTKGPRILGSRPGPGPGEVYFRFASATRPVNTNTSRIISPCANPPRSRTPADTDKADQGWKRVSSAPPFARAGSGIAASKGDPFRRTCIVGHSCRGKPQAARFESLWNRGPSATTSPGPRHRARRKPGGRRTAFNSGLSQL